MNYQFNPQDTEALRIPATMPLDQVIQRVTEARVEPVFPFVPINYPVEIETKDEPVYHVYCPTCKGSVWVYHHELNCRIFRHAIYKSTGHQVPPHTSKEECESLVRQNLVFGCGGPFKLVETMPCESTGEMEVELPRFQAVLCDYI